MTFNFLNLDDKTRQFMVDEVKIARDSDNLYFSKRFTNKGRMRWPDLLQEAVSAHDEYWLARQIESEELMSNIEDAKTASGDYTTRQVPYTAAETLADGQFNRFYILGVCRRAIEEGMSNVVVYRAQERAVHRSVSDAMIGNSVSSQELIIALRSRESSLRHDLLKPNSGLSVHLRKEG